MIKNFNYRRTKFNRNISLADFSFKEILSCDKTVRFIALLTNSCYKKLKRKVISLHRVLQKMIKSNGLECVCKRMKESEKTFLFSRKTKWFSLKHVTGNGISTNATKVLLSLHRNMRVIPKLDVTSLYHKPISVKRFLKNYKLEIKDVLKHPLFNIQAYKDIVVKSNKYWKTILSSKRYNPFTYDPTVDSNDRTGGDRFPLCVNIKGRSNGSSLTSQKMDHAYISNSALKTDIEYLYSEWKYVYTDPYQHSEEDIKNAIPSKLHLIKDKSCKTRVIAIFDTISQIALRPLHKMLQDKLDSYKRDFTFSHLMGVKSLINKDLWHYSADLSKATDSIPRSLSFYILRKMVRHCVTNPKRFVHAISNILVKRKFYYGKKFYHYTAGQPMGAYGSFPLLGITNHFITLLSYRITFGKRYRRLLKYSIVGDDVVMTSKDFKSCSKLRIVHSNLCKELDIPINTQKCVFGQNSFEFCKRIVVKGHIESFPSWNSIYQSVKLRDPYPVLSLMKDHEWGIPSYSSLISIKKPYRFMRGLKNPNKAWLFDKKMVKNLLALTQLKLRGQPKVKKIPTNVIYHADRCLQFREAIKNSHKLSTIKTEDPYLSRLNYNVKIVKIIKKTHKKVKSLWALGSKARCNTFYLSYIDCYKTMKSRKRKLYKLDYDNGRSKILRHYCMSSKNLWNKLQ